MPSSDTSTRRRSVAEQIVVWCDRCLATDVQVTGKPLPVTLGGIDWRVDLCEPCHEELVGPLSALLESVGQKLRKGSPSASGPTTSVIDLTRSRALGSKASLFYHCLLCPGVAYTSNTSLSTHYSNEHGVPGGSLSHIYGNTCPKCATTFDTYQGVSMHCTRAYQTPLTKLFLDMREEGDPHGVVAQALARLRKVAV